MASKRVVKPFLALGGVVVILALVHVVGCDRRADQPAGRESQESQRVGPVKEAVKSRAKSSTSSMRYDEPVGALGELPRPARAYRMAAVVEFLGNPYCRAIADGMHAKARELGIRVQIRAAASDADPTGQLAEAEAMLAKGCDILLISPQTEKNLAPAANKAKSAGLPVLEVGESFSHTPRHRVGPDFHTAGNTAARYMVEHIPQGGSVAVIQGLAGSFAVRRLTRGFTEALAGTQLRIVEKPYCAWDLQTSLEKATHILHAHPDLKGFFCHSDVMALGVVEAVKLANRTGHVVVVGAGGIEKAFESIRTGEMTATVDFFPHLTGRMAIETALRILVGQRVPPTVYSPQRLITEVSLKGPPEQAPKEP